MWACSNVARGLAAMLQCGLQLCCKGACSYVAMWLAAMLQGGLQLCMIWWPKAPLEARRHLKPL